VRRRVQQFFGAPPLDRVNADEVVAIGAAIQAAALTEVARRRSIPPPPAPRARRSSLPPAELEGDDEVTMATRIPSRIAEHERARVSSPSFRPPAAPRPSVPVVPPAPPTVPTATARLASAKSTLPLPGASSSPTLPPDDVGATIPNPVRYQDVVRATMSPDPAPPAPPTPVLVDVTPRALVVETVGGWCDVVVQRNAKIPCERTRAFTTSSDNQTVVQVRVAQGEDALFRNNTFLGAVELVGLRAAPRGIVTIRTRFEVDESGTLKVFATDLGTGKEAHALLQLVGIAATDTVEAMQARHAAARVS
jgi:molecular chaperone DnaK